MLEGERHLRRVHASLLQREAAQVLEVSEKVPTVDIVEAQIKLGLGLECKLETDDEGVVHSAENAVLGLRAADLVPSDQHLLGEDLHGIELLGVLLSDKHNLAKGTTPDHLQKEEVFDADLACVRQSVLIHHLVFWHSTQGSAAGLLSAATRRNRFHGGDPVLCLSGGLRLDHISPLRVNDLEGVLLDIVSGQHSATGKHDEASRFPIALVLEVAQGSSARVEDKVALLP
mmetsp:Transcript_68716/g.161555  ORF Transcript_68716/g.161555 Transcript_68716/m.161555 type:complete len:230 (-) Transcript_68716:70-759(-)